MTPLSPSGFWSSSRARSDEPLFARTAASAAAPFALTPLNDSVRLRSAVLARTAPARRDRALVAEAVGAEVQPRELAVRLEGLGERPPARRADVVVRHLEVGDARRGSQCASSLALRAARG